MKKKVIIICMIIFIILAGSVCFGGRLIMSGKLCQAIEEHDEAEVEKLVNMPFSNKFINAPTHVELGSDCQERPVLPIQYAASEGLPQILKLLMDNGADVNKHTKYTSAALGYILDEEMSYSDLECVRLLVNGGADLDGHEYSEDAAGLEPYSLVLDDRYVLDHDLKEDSLEIYKLIIDSGISRSEETVCAELYNAVNSNNYAIVRYILENNKDISLEPVENDDDRQGVLFYLNTGICDEETVKIAELLIEAGADKTLTDDDGDTVYKRLKGISDEDIPDKDKKRELMELVRP